MTNKLKAVKHVLVNRYRDDERFGEAAEVFEMTLDIGHRISTAEMHFVVKKGGRASVSLSQGTQTGMTHLTKEFLKIYGVKTLINQVSRESELKAMYAAGLRCPVYKTNRFGQYMSLKETQDYLKRTGSIPMVINL